MPTTTAETLSLVTRNVTVAPLVLLSAVDHYNRTVSTKTKRRVVGVLLGQNEGNDVRVSNSFAGVLSWCHGTASWAALTMVNYSSFRGG
jgi:26S proteasome regulatory subunit N8